METTEESVTDYFLYVKNVLGVKTLQSSSLVSALTESSQEPQPSLVPEAPRFRTPTAAGPEAVKSPRNSFQSTSEIKSEVAACDVLFLHIRMGKEESVFSPEIKALSDKMIQAMRLGKRKVLTEEMVFTTPLEEVNATDILQAWSSRVQASYVILYSSKPGVQGVLKNLGPQKYIETFSPSYLMDHPQAKKVAWLDLQKVMKELGIS